MIDVNKLKGKMVEQGLSVSDVAKAAGLSTASLYRKMSGRGETMYVKDAYAIGKMLCLDADEMNTIFFAPIVSKMRQKA